MLPIANILPTSLLVPISFTRRWVPFSITWSWLSVYWGGVALGSHLMSGGMSYIVRELESLLSDNDCACQMSNETKDNEETYMIRDEDWQRTDFREYTMSIDRSSDGIDLWCSKERCISVKNTIVFLPGSEPGREKPTVSPLKGLHTTAL